MRGGSGRGPHLLARRPVEALLEAAYLQSELLDPPPKSLGAGTRCMHERTKFVCVCRDHKLRAEY